MAQAWVLEKSGHCFSCAAVFIPLAWVAALSMPAGWRVSIGGPKQNYNVGLWRIAAESVPSSTLGDDCVDAFCDNTIENGQYLMWEVEHVACNDPSQTSWCQMWRTLAVSSLIMIASGVLSVFFLIVGACSVRCRSRMWPSIFVGLGPIISACGLMYYYFSTFDFPHRCNGGYYCRYFLYQGFGPVFFLTVCVTLWAFIPAIIVCAAGSALYSDTADSPEFLHEASLELSDRCDQTPEFIADSNEFGTAADCGARVLPQDGDGQSVNSNDWVSDSWAAAHYPLAKGSTRQTLTPWLANDQGNFTKAQEIYTSVKTGHCVSGSSVLMALALAVALCMPSGWHNSDAGPKQNYFVGLWRIEVEQALQSASVENCGDMYCNETIADGVHPMWLAGKLACTEIPWTPWCKIWKKLAFSSFVMLVCGGISVLLILIGATFGQCKNAYGARTRKAFFLGLGPLVSMGGLVYYFVSTSSFPYRCKLWCSLSAFGFGPWYWCSALLTLLSFLPAIIVCCTKRAPRSSALDTDWGWVDNSHGVSTLFAPLSGVRSLELGERRAIEPVPIPNSNELAERNLPDTNGRMQTAASQLDPPREQQHHHQLFIEQESGGLQDDYKSELPKWNSNGGVLQQSAHRGSFQQQNDQPPLSHDSFGKFDGVPPEKERDYQLPIPQGNLNKIDGFRQSICPPLLEDLSEFSRPKPQGGLQQHAYQSGVQPADQGLHSQSPDFGLIDFGLAVPSRTVPSSAPSFCNRPVLAVSQAPMLSQAPASSPAPYRHDPPSWGPPSWGIPSFSSFRSNLLAARRDFGI